MSMTRAELNQAFREAIILEFVDVPKADAVIDFSFSNIFERKMGKLITRQKKNYWKYINTAKKRVAVAVVMILSAFMLALGKDEVRAFMFQWCADIYDTHIHYYFEGDTTKVIEHEYYLTMVPDGFEVVREQTFEGMRRVEYKNDVGEHIIFAQYSTDGYSYMFDNDKTEVLECEIRGLEIKVYIWEEIMGAMWCEDGYYMNLQYIGCDDIEIIKEMVYAIE